MPGHSPANPFSRRDWLRTTISATAGLALAPGAALAQTGKRRPNVVLIVADDLGSRDLGCYGATDLPTKHIDQLATDGVRFDQFYVNAPACLPSRASLLTGRYHERCTKPGVGMLGSETTMAELLGAAGYHTAIYGKWHLGLTADVRPKGQGFDEFVGFIHGAMDNYSHYYYWGTAARPDLWRNNRQHLEGGDYFPDLMTDEAVRFIARKKEDPFFLYLPFNLPHYPMQPTAEAYMAAGHITDPARRMYAACVLTMDECIGRVTQALQDNGLTEDTVVIFLSDHGHSTEADSMGGGGRATPYRGEKATLWDGGLRVPCIVSWPGGLPKGAVRHQPAMGIDWLPTISQWCGLNLAGLGVDGHSLDNIIRSPSAPSTRSTLAWSWQKWFAVREGPWKLVVDDEQNAQLSNLDNDPAESQNLLTQNPQVARRLVESYESWLADVRNATVIPTAKQLPAPSLIRRHGQ